ncbi:hypothetical protein QQ045_022088 [Rhodiola kirilowii]
MAEVGPPPGMGVSTLGAMEKVQARSFADILKGGPGNIKAAQNITKPVQSILFPPIQLAPRQYGIKEGKPSVSFSPTELQAGVDNLKYALVAKFSTGRPPIDQVRQAFMDAWNMDGKCSIGALDARHILIVPDSEQEARKVLAHPARKVGHAFFRVSRWSKDFDVKKESPITTVWIRLLNLPPGMINQGYIESIVASFSRFVAVDIKTASLTNPSYARVCVEMDMAKSYPDAVWINTGGEGGFWQKISYESRLAFCSRCKIHGHTLDVCRKAMKRRLEEQQIWANRDEHGLPILRASNTNAGKVYQECSDPSWFLVQNRKGRTTNFPKNKLVPITNLVQQTCTNSASAKKHQKDVLACQNEVNGGPPKTHMTVGTTITCPSSKPSHPVWIKGRKNFRTKWSNEHTPHSDRPISPIAKISHVSAGTVANVASPAQRPARQDLSPTVPNLRPAWLGLPSAGRAQNLVSPIHYPTSVDQAPKDLVLSSAMLTISTTISGTIDEDCIGSQDVILAPDSQPNPALGGTFQPASKTSIGLINGKVVEFSSALGKVLKRVEDEATQGRLIEDLQQLFDYSPSASEKQNGSNMTSKSPTVSHVSTTTHLKALCTSHKPSIVAILEPKISNDRLAVLCKDLGFDHFLHGEETNNHIWLIWKDGMELDNASWSSQQVTIRVRYRSSNETACFSFVYADCDDKVRRTLWEDLIDSSEAMSVPWFVIGDFNVISSWDEKSGGVRDSSRSVRWWLQWQPFHLVQQPIRRQSHLGAAGPAPPKWTCNGFLPFSSTHLTRVHSDHCPILMELDSTHHNIALFHYQKVWQSHPGFMDRVRSGWEGKIHINPLINFGLKLKRLRSFLRKWNWDVFGDTRIKMKDLLSHINNLETQLQQGWLPDIATDLLSSKANYKAIADIHDAILKSKARMDWIRHGDHNSRLFHAAIKSRRAKNKINLLLGDGSYSNDRDVIGNVAVTFYKDLFALSILEPVIRPEDNEDLCRPPSCDEVHKCISDMSLDSAPGPDGFTGHFYVHCWMVIKEDLMGAIVGFFEGLQIPNSFSATFLTLLPKVPNASSIDQLRPISLCNFCHKIISRILTSRLSNWLPKIISEEQVGFVQGRSIHENIALAHDITHDLNDKVYGGNVIVKLDMAKAYDRISWGFILRILHSLGFNNCWYDLIYRCISNCSYSMKWDGRLYGFFRSSRGVRQGDPLSPSLFVIAMEWFSRVMKAADRFGVLKAYITKRPSIRINHLLFADDLLIFTNGAKNSFRNLLGIIDDFCAFSGQHLNSSKSLLICPKGFDPSRKMDLLALSSFSEGTLPQVYLGAPLYRGRTRIDLFDSLVNKVDARIEGWANSLLSMGGRVTLCNAVLSSIGIHSMMVLPVPATILARIASRVANFVWDSGGTWSFLEKKTLWARFSKGRFKVGERGSGIWNAFHHLIEAIQGGSSWKIGRGNTLLSEFCWRVGGSVPPNMGQLPISNLLASPTILRDILSTLPAGESKMLQRATLGITTDRCLWHGKDNFSVKAFRAFGQTVYPSLTWASMIWRSWIPPKISFFIWRLFQRAIPTDDAIKRVGIPIASRCVCCASPHEESANHLFFNGDWGRNLWLFLARLFNKPRVHGLKGLAHAWLASKHNDLMACLAPALAMCGMWELWRARNSSIFEGKTVDWIRNTEAWGPLLAALISKPLVQHPGASLTFKTLGIGNYKIAKPGHWSLWSPRMGHTNNMAIGNRGTSRWGGVVARDKKGSFLFSFCCIIPPGTDRELSWFIESTLSTARSSGVAGRAYNIQSSHPLMSDLTGVGDESCPLESIYNRRRLSHQFGIATFYKICAAANGPALLVTFHADPGLAFDVRILPRPSQIALKSDRSRLPVQCQGACDDPGINPIVPRDGCIALFGHPVSLNTFSPSSGSVSACSAFLREVSPWRLRACVSILFSIFKVVGFITSTWRLRAYCIRHDPGFLDLH